MGMLDAMSVYNTAITVGVSIVILTVYFFARSNANAKPVPLFWTGGYDSTYRLCELLLIEKRAVQPIYIAANIDNDPGESTCRHNHIQEKAAMAKIRSEILAKYPDINSQFMSTIVISEVLLPERYKSAMLDLYKQNLVRRPTCQYGALAYIAEKLTRMGEYAPAEICVENEPTSKMHRTIYPFISKFGRKTGMNTKNFISSWNSCKSVKGMHIFKAINFSTIHKSKSIMLNIAKKHNFENILNLTWSCWYPIDNKPCRKCIMCKERII